MARLLPNSIYIMIPRCGCMTTESILKQLGLWQKDIRGRERFWHPDVKELKELGWWDKRPFKFTFIRHPFDWLKSRWCYFQIRGFNSLPGSKQKYIEPAELYYDPDFNKFLENCIEYYEKCGIGMVTQLYNEYTEDANFVGKLENLRNDLEKALILAGESYNSSIIHKSISINQAYNTTKWRDNLYYTVSNYRKIIEIENETIKKYKYNQITSL